MQIFSKYIHVCVRACVYKYAKCTDIYYVNKPLFRI